MILSRIFGEIPTEIPELIPLEVPVEIHGKQFCGMPATISRGSPAGVLEGIPRITTGSIAGRMPEKKT